MFWEQFFGNFFSYFTKDEKKLFFTLPSTYFSMVPKKLGFRYPILPLYIAQYIGTYINGLGSSLPFPFDSGCKALHSALKYKNDVIKSLKKRKKRQAFIFILLKKFLPKMYLHSLAFEARQSTPLQIILFFRNYRVMCTANAADSE